MIKGKSRKLTKYQANLVADAEMQMELLQELVLARLDKAGQNLYQLRETLRFESGLLSGHLLPRHDVDVAALPRDLRETLDISYAMATLAYNGVAYDG